MMRGAYWQDSCRPANGEPAGRGEHEGREWNEVVSVIQERGDVTWAKVMAEKMTRGRFI